ncbi:hypothetical protein BBJ28_00021114 [Nothophytophthora sp. Chile5]|nr:hypothetical protein BBJ28_00021114 [Nothophytophthora sp. Chile5]
MSFKPELFADEEGKQLPLAHDDELFILERAKIAFQCKTSDSFAWKITFANGGTGVVLPVFLRLLDKRKKKETIDLSFVQSQKKAFVDPNDPTVIYIAQPVKPIAAV